MERGGFRGYRDKKFKAKVATHGGAYRKKLRVNKEGIKEYFKKTEEKELGTYRHNSNFINYDEIINRAVNKWGLIDPILTLEIIHVIQNKANSLILACILEAQKEKIDERNKVRKPRKVNRKVQSSYHKSRPRLQNSSNESRKKIL